MNDMLIVLHGIKGYPTIGTDPPALPGQTIGIVSCSDLPTAPPGTSYTMNDTLIVLHGIKGYPTIGTDPPALPDRPSA